MVMLLQGSACSQQQLTSLLQMTDLGDHTASMHHSMLVPPCAMQRGWHSRCYTPDAALLRLD